MGAEIRWSGRRRTIALLAGLVLLLVVFGGSGIAGADAVYHTERLELTPVASGETGAGMVVNIHPNGPVNGALERYQLKKAQPDTEYAVWLVVSGDAAFVVNTATIVTDGNGNGHAKAGFSAADLAGLAGAELQVKWELRVNSTVAYETETTTVNLD